MCTADAYAFVGKLDRKSMDRYVGCMSGLEVFILNIKTIWKIGQTSSTRDFYGFMGKWVAQVGGSVDIVHICDIG